jgi:hypothetical protein
MNLPEQPSRQSELVFCAVVIILLGLLLSVLGTVSHMSWSIQNANPTVLFSDPKE